ncbi:hypothetical protein GCM10009801_75340 [Streptomyces albiaxialis]|uniref:Uncharacterized protein n=1 Tax=Streptomyces albiaxialis TaxID=329523 RepID=A0ABN2WZL7_9ACTN
MTCVPAGAGLGQWRSARGDVRRGVGRWRVALGARGEPLTILHTVRRASGPVALQERAVQEYASGAQEGRRGGDSSTPLTSLATRGTIPPAQQACTTSLHNKEARNGS